jgi:RimJ/RimL family protein N-acetyltransferase
MIDVQLHRSTTEFGDIADHLYGRDPVLFTVELTALKSASPSPDNILLSVWDGGQLLGALVRTPPCATMASGSPPVAAPFVAKILAPAGYELASISGLTANAVAFADAWRVATAAKTTVEVEEQLYRLGTLHSPAEVIGKPRAARRDDIDLLTDWFDQFHVEAFGFASAPDRWRAFLDHLLQSGGVIFLWTLDGTPVSMAPLHPAVASMSRIGPVFTPTTRRGQGYGSAVTAAAAHHALSQGGPAQHVVLFADLANPVSNTIYQRLGFEPVACAVRSLSTRATPRRRNACSLPG